MKFSIIVPAYNEEKGVAEVITGLKKSLESSGAEYEIIVVDDASTDETAEMAQQQGVLLIRHLINQGYGAAIMTGIKAAKYDTVVTIDADGSYAPQDLLKLLKYAEDFDLVAGSRTGQEYRGRLLKYPARIVFRALAEYVSGDKIPDINSGLRIFNKLVFNSFPNIHICRGFSFSTTTTLMFLVSNYYVKFVPIDYQYRRGKSKIKYIRDTLRALQILLEIAVHYNPIKAILPFCAIPFMGMIAFFAAYFVSFNYEYLLGGAISLYVAIMIFTAGMLLLQIRLSGGK